ncbi:1-deoxy-D-xylulose-5-phosphate reductoisomerase [Thermophilibacter provencensis]|uniref:1-deoxy-D-xylulose 5-phosphate reductoisomerase n=1 Tax=Thermophilibacter provencensis TaxID=1852386 RepID=A0ABT7V2Y1_9ACTN|nr:1-deoxy-D-xylulose-5-phosphate reductoisomerase [Thermophilibacter provencensis]MDM8270960.1 1-deoxy-D-xylulose-5-phosphate reductoisomerase [Thermophilibacter provencensis]
MTIFQDRPVRTAQEGPVRVAVLGCSGSIGTQTLDVCRRHPDKVRVVALSVMGSTRRLVDAAREFGVAHVAVVDERAAKDPVLSELPASCELGVGARAVTRLAELPDVDVVVNALVGFAGIHAGFAALSAHKKLAYANKESIVVGGDLMMPLVRPGRLLPVDSEHSAIYQCIVGERPEDVSRIWLTCSGGPFYGRNRDELASVTAADALAHPTWTMGEKITIDCSTLMNKGLEVIEAHHLFQQPIDAIRVLVHRQSKIHSMVEFVDGVVKAQLGSSDMRAPIQYALSYPERWQASATRVDWCAEDPLTFGEADERTFGCLALAREAGRVGGTLPCAMNAANEVANEAFRKGLCGFLDIERIVSRVMDKTCAERVESLEQLDECDARSRALAGTILSEVSR